jgi:hypothetical protein
MILCSAVPSRNQEVAQARSPESLEYTPSVDDITFWVIDIENGKVKSLFLYRLMISLYF